MATHSTSNPLGIVDKRKSGANSTAGTNATTANYNSVENMRTRLTAIDATYFTPKRLNEMSDNDMKYALRLRDDAASF